MLSRYEVYLANIALPIVIYIHIYIDIYIFLNACLGVVIDLSFGYNMAFFVPKDFLGLSVPRNMGPSVPSIMGPSVPSSDGFASDFKVSNSLCLFNIYIFF